MGSLSPGSPGGCQGTAKPTASSAGPKDSAAALSNCSLYVSGRGRGGCVIHVCGCSTQTGVSVVEGEWGTCEVPTGLLVSCQSSLHISCHVRPAPYFPSCNPSNTLCVCCSPADVTCIPACRVSPARIACLDMNLQKARLQMGVQVRGGEHMDRGTVTSH